MAEKYKRKAGYAKSVAKRKSKKYLEIRSHIRDNEKRKEK